MPNKLAGGLRIDVRYRLTMGFIEDVGTYCFTFYLTGAVVRRGIPREEIEVSLA